MPSPTSEARELGRTTKIEGLTCIASTSRARPDQAVDIKVKFQVRGGLYDVFNRSTWQQAYESHDTLLRLMFRIGLYRRTSGFVSSAVVKPVKFVRKGRLYWIGTKALSQHITVRMCISVVKDDVAKTIRDLKMELRN